jgi:hypothetical protein
MNVVLTRRARIALLQFDNAVFGQRNKRSLARKKHHEQANSSMI